MNTHRKISKQLANITCIAAVLSAVFVGAPQHKASAAADTIFVHASALWVPTGIYLDQYRDAFIDVHGMAITGNMGEYPGAKSGPAGQEWNLGCGQYDGAPPPCALDDAPYGALVGRIGEDGAPFLIGDASIFQPPTSGFLYLAVNDNLAFYDDNSGGFSFILRSGNLAGGTINARPDENTIQGRYWPYGQEVRIRIFDRELGLLYKDTQIVGGDPGDPASTEVYFDLGGAGFDLQPGQRILMDSRGYTRELWVAPVAVTGYDFQAATVTGTCDPSIFCWAHMDTRDFNFIEMDGSTWTAHFDYLVPWEEGWAFQWDQDGDETRVRFKIDTPDARMISALPDRDEVEGVYWKVGQEVALQVFDGVGGELLYEEALTPWADEFHVGGSYVRSDLGGGSVDLQPGFFITMTITNEYEQVLLTRELVITSVAVTGYDLEAGTVWGTCDRGVFFYTHKMDNTDALDMTVGEDNACLGDGQWTATFETLTSGEEITAFQWDQDGDETRVFFTIP